MNLSAMDFQQVKKYLANGKRGLILPIGTCEQHGEHLPLGTDTLVAEYMAKEFSRHTGLLVAPTLHYGVNLPLDRSMSGTAGLEETTLHHLLSELLDWWRGQGFSPFLLITCHGDPFHLKAFEGLGKDVLAVEPEGEIEYGDILEKQDTVRHACEAETSIMLYLYPELVQMEKVREHDIPFPDFRDYLYHQKDSQPEGYVGNLGYPSLATREKGEILVQRMLQYLFDAWRQFVDNISK